MNKKMRDLQAQIQAKTDEAKGFMDGDNKDLEKANALMDEVEKLQSEYDLAQKIYNQEKQNGAEKAVTPVEDNAQPQDEEKTFTGEQMIAKQVRGIMAPMKYGADKALNETTAADGGYTVPEDVQTKVNNWPETEFSFLSVISEEKVTTNKGSRTYQARGDAEAFTDIDENGVLTKEIEAPKFERVSYQIQNRAGFMPVSNDLVSDSDSNIMSIVVKWLGRATVATVNAKVRAIIAAHKNPKGDGTFEATAGAQAIGGINGIKKIVNVILGQAYKGSAVIVTNDDGLQYLDTLVDTNNRPLLNPDPTDSARLTLRCGTVVVPIKVIPNKALPTDVKTGSGAYTKVPFIIGDLKAGIMRYNRESMSIMASNVATIGNGTTTFNAFAQNMTLIRAILRDDYKELDKAAYYNGYIDTTAQA